jgi:hypothetical protein
MIFGSIIIMLLGVLVSYALRYNLQQRTQQQVFRKALVESRNATLPGTPKSVQYTKIWDAHITSPLDSFGMGSVTPIMASAGVTRDYEAGKSPQPDNIGDPPYNISQTGDLPEVQIEMDGKMKSFKTAGYRIAYTVPDEKIEKFTLIYGAGGVQKLNGSCLQWIADPYYDPIYEDPNMYNNSGDGGGPGQTCEKWAYDLLIIDSSAGQIMDYDVTFSRCKQLTEPEFCKQVCGKDLDKDPETGCDRICGHDISKYTPWYCDSGVLAKLFRMAPGNKPLPMGLQQDYTQDTNVVGNVSRKVESESGIKVTDATDWHVVTERKIIVRDLNNTQGDTKVEKIDGEVSQKEQFIWDVQK